MAEKPEPLPPDAEKLAARCAAKFDALIDPLRAVARTHGYALAVHGSLSRDIDLVAVPWAEKVSPPDVLAAAIRDEADRVTGCAFWINHDDADPNDHTKRNPAPKPHGRLAWSIHLGGGPYIDLSILASPALPPTVVAVLRACEHDETTDCASFDCPDCRAVGEAKDAWIAAGRPGLPEVGK
jgi:hypothetical protein